MIQKRPSRSKGPEVRLLDAYEMNIGPDKSGLPKLPKTTISRLSVAVSADVWPVDRSVIGTKQDQKTHISLASLGSASRKTPCVDQAASIL